MRASPELFPEPPPPWAIRLLLALRRGLLRLADRIIPAEWALIERSAGMGQTQLLGAVARRGMADLLAEGPKTSEEISAAIGTQPDITLRLMRALSGAGIFQRTEDGRFENSRLSEAMRSGTGARAWLEYFSLRSNVSAWAELEQTWVTGQDGFRRNFGKNVWEYFHENPAEAEVFAQTLRGITTTHAPIVSKLYPFHELRRICDVGGGMGTLLSELLLRHPNLTGILYEPAQVLALAQPYLQARGVADRVQSVPGSFFEIVPPGSDAYLLKNILHDWDDADCGRILAACRRAMEPGQRLLVLESLLEPEVVDGPVILSDLQMMVVCANGRERSEEELRDLLERHGFRLNRTFRHPLISVLEGVVQSA